MKEAPRWKSKLLASSVPLEYEVTRVLADADWMVSADYPYLRKNAGVDTEFSVDIHAYTITREGKGLGAPPCGVDVLIECKHRHPGTAWLFMPDPNRLFRMGLMGSVLTPVDKFSCWFVDTSTSDVDAKMNRCYKGVEVDITSGNVHDAEIRRGIAQLQFALPSLFATRIRDVAAEHPALNTPFFVGAILLTNAPLLVAQKTFGSCLVARARSIEQLGHEVPYLSLYVEAGPEFQRHAAAEFGDLPKLARRRALADAERHREAAGEKAWLRPKAMLSAMATGAASSRAASHFERLIVCNHSHLKSLLRLLLTNANKLVTSARTDMKKSRTA